MSPFKMYRYVFYKLYARKSFNKLAFDKDENKSSSLRALLELTCLVCLNIIGIWGTLLVVFKFEFLNFFPDINFSEKVTVISVGFAIWFCNYLLLVRNGKYLNIYNEFKDETDKQRKNGIILVITYVLLTFFMLPFILLFSIIRGN